MYILYVGLTVSMHIPASEKGAIKLEWGVRGECVKCEGGELKGARDKGEEIEGCEKHCFFLQNIKKIKKKNFFFLKNGSEHYNSG